MHVSWWDMSSHSDCCKPKVDVFCGLRQWHEAVFTLGDTSLYVYSLSSMLGQRQSA